MERENRMQLTPDRLRHSLAVARKMKELAAAGTGQLNPEEAFLVGYLHDVGYEDAGKQEDHAHRGGLLLRRQHYPYWQEIYYHGEVQDAYASPMLDLLNYCDMTTGPAGQPMTLSERLADIEMRYGSASPQAQSASALCRRLRERFPESGLSTGAATDGK